MSWQSLFNIWRRACHHSSPTNACVPVPTPLLPPRASEMWCMRDLTHSSHLPGRAWAGMGLMGASTRLAGARMLSMGCGEACLDTPEDGGGLGGRRKLPGPRPAAPRPARPWRPPPEGGLLTVENPCICNAIALSGESPATAGPWTRATGSRTPGPSPTRMDKSRDPAARPGRPRCAAPGSPAQPPSKLLDMLGMGPATLLVDLIEPLEDCLRCMAR